MTRTLLARRLGRVALVVAAASVSCTPPPPAGTTPVTPSEDAGPPPPSPPDMSIVEAPFEATTPWAYVPKIKDLLVGQAPTDQEMRAVVADAKALGGLIDAWMAQPEYHDKMLAFFRNAFQQGQIAPGDLADQLPQGLRGTGTNTARLMKGIQESFARTVWQLIAEKRPFYEVVTTKRYMLTPPLMAILAYIDNVHIDDAGARVDRFLKANPKLGVSVTNQAVPVADSLDPKSANYMVWSNPVAIPANAPLGCNVFPRVYGRNTGVLYDLIFGYLDGYGNLCQPSYTGTGLFADADYDDWRMVTVRPPAMGEAPTDFFNVPAIKAASELVLTVPRVGFFGTPAFFANWQTNSSNQARVTMNQTLIVALGASFDDSNDITPVAETALDMDHAAPGSPCYSCHKTLDPMRQYFRQAYTLSYSLQADAKQSTVPGVFAFGGETSPGKDIYDLADKLAAHPRFAAAWAQKVCFWANSAACSEDDPEFLRIVAAFQTANFDWSVLVKEMLTSPLTTGAARTKTFKDRGVVVNVARRDSLCTALSNRLGIADVCGLTGTGPLNNMQKKAQELSTGVPSDGYTRGSVAPLLANDSSLFHRSATENLCRALADALVDVPMNPRYNSKYPDPAIADMVHTIMALPAADPRADAVQKILNDHLVTALKGGFSLTDSLKSTFVLACESPTSVARGL